MKVGGRVTGVTVDPSKSSKLTVTLAGMWERIMGSVRGEIGRSNELGVRWDALGCVKGVIGVSDGSLAEW